jgi:hypothetical protein
MGVEMPRALEEYYNSETPEDCVVETAEATHFSENLEFLRPSKSRGTKNGPPTTTPTAA